MSTPGIIHPNDTQPRSGPHVVWYTSAHWFTECLAEFIGVFMYVYAGVGSQLVFILGGILQESEGSSSVFQIGCAYAAGSVFAVALALPISGGHLSPGITIAFYFTRGTPFFKAVRYIIAQILGSYIACLLIYFQYRDMIKSAEAALSSAGELDAVLFTPRGPAGAFGLYVSPGTNLGRVFVNELVSDLMITFVIFNCLDPSKMIMPLYTTPFVIGLVYAVTFWGYYLPGLAANTARDVGGRLAAVTIWGSKATGGSSTYATIAALTNIPATLISALLYDKFFANYAGRVFVSTPVVELAPAHAHENYDVVYEGASDRSGNLPTNGPSGGRRGRKRK